MPASSDILTSDGSLDWSSGVNSLKTPTVQSPQVPNGLTRNQLAWLVNGTMRGGPVSPRDGWTQKGQIVGEANLTGSLGSSFQGGFFYQPASGTPYLIMVVGGHVIQVDPDFVNPPVDLSAQFNLFHPVTAQCFFEQAETYLVIQAGDYDPVSGNGTLPLFWDGESLVRSNGLTGTINRGFGTPTIYNASLSASFAVPVAGAYVTLSLTAPFPGFLYDKVRLSVNVTTSGTTTLTAVGDFAVTGIIGNTVSLYCVDLSGAGFVGMAGDVVPISDDPLQFIVEMQSGVFATSPVLSPSTITQSLPLAPWNAYVQDYLGALPKVPAVGSQVTIAMAFMTNYPLYNLIGHTIYCFGTAYGASSATVFGTFLIVSAGGSGSSLVTLQTVSLGVGITAGHAFYVNSGSSGAAQYGFDYLDLNELITPSAGQQITIPVATSASLPTGTPYIGGVGDLLTFGAMGTYTVIAAPGMCYLNRSGFALEDSLDFGYASMTLQAVAPLNVGLPFALTAPVAGKSATIAVTVSQARTINGQSLNQIPAASWMKYYQGLLWYSQGRTVSAGDIVGGPSGTQANQFKDSVLYVTENPLCVGGDGFTMPLQGSNITGLAVVANINAALGQGQLMVGTLDTIFSLSVPANRQTWISQTASNPPQIAVVQLANGWVGQTGVVQVNGDLFYRSMGVDIRSLIQAERYFQTWGNVALSSNEQWLFAQENPTLINFCSGIYFNNRLLMSALPVQTPYGVACQAIIPLDFAPISTLETQLPPNWEGHYEGLQVLQLLSATFNGRQRAFIISLATPRPSGMSGEMDLWEILPQSIGDVSLSNGTGRTQTQIILPAFTADIEFDLKKLVSMELWLDQIQGTVDVLVEYRPDGMKFWQTWCQWRECANVGQSYPGPQYAQGYAQTRTLPKPPEAANPATGRLCNVGYQFQPRITFTGQSRLRGMTLCFETVTRKLYTNLPPEGTQ